MNPLGLIFFALYWVVFIYSVVLHEYAHGWVAFKLGDPTAYREGRLTLNPLKHIDPFMSILMPAMLFIGTGGNMIFGGAKPVPVNPYLYRNMRKGIIMDSAAGPATNFLLAVIFSLGFAISLALADQKVTLTGNLLANCMILNLVLGTFNLLPIPPLDGSHVLSSILPRSLRDSYEGLRPFGLFILIGLFAFRPTSEFLHGVIMSVMGFFFHVMGIKGTLLGQISLTNLLGFAAEL